jgi:hypothetical protein
MGCVLWLVGSFLPNKAWCYPGATRGIKNERNCSDQGQGDGRSSQDRIRNSAGLFPSLMLLDKLASAAALLNG